MNGKVVVKAVSVALRAGLSMALAGALVGGVAGGAVGAAGADVVPEASVRQAVVHTATTDIRCVPVQVLLIPGTAESSFVDDPTNPPIYEEPTMGPMFHYLKGQLDPAVYDLWQVPYASTGLDYERSRASGMAVAEARMRAVAEACPEAKFLIMGFSQGADIAGDLTANIGWERGPVAEQQVLGSLLLSDPRRVPGQGIPAGTGGAGSGVMVAWAPLFEWLAWLCDVGIMPSAVVSQVIHSVQPLGAREQSFGSMEAKTTSFCAANDMVCDIPTTGWDLLRYPLILNRVHAGYVDSYTFVDGPLGFILRGFMGIGRTVPQWVLEWVRAHS
ncbi:MAG: cutinase family protein [Corynebacterium sp.]|nr:cutinase family protein [Corynebacterium sp.]